METLIDIKIKNSHKQSILRLFGRRQALLPYYKIQKTEEDKKFFFSHEGYFNFWNEYLICNINPNEKLYWVIVNRTGHNFSTRKPSEN